MEDLKYTEILKRNRSLTGTINSKPYSIGILANITINSFKEILEYNCRVHEIEPAIEIGNFDNIVQDSATFNNKDAVIICYDMMGIVANTSVFFEHITEENYNALFQKLASEIDLIFNNLKSVPSVIFNLFSTASFTPDYTGTTKKDQFANDLNRYLEGKRSPNITLVNTDRIITRIGLKQAIDYRFYYSSQAPYTIAYFKEYAVAIQPVLLRNTGKLKKALIFDCDNTLWKGIIGEDGVDGIEMSPLSQPGMFYHKVQQLAVHLSKMGIIIGLCSKNNPEDVEEVMQHEDMVLTNEHVVIKKVNWQDKATNLREIARELNIGLDSLIFVDDSDFEITLIREQVREVLTFQVPTHITDYPDQLQRLAYQYFNLKQSKEDSGKTEMYKQQFQREESKSTFASIEDYLASLEIVLTISRDNMAQVPRIAQMTQKTNQFNLTTIRYTDSQIQQFMETEHAAIFTIFVQDKFGDSGLTGVCIIRKDQADNAKASIDSLLMSCRIIGRNIEFVFMDHIIKALAQTGIKQITATYIPTKKNAQVEQFYDTVGFVPEARPGSDKHYILDISAYHSKDFSYIRIKEEESQNKSDDNN
jgi:FkbH-like protein